MRHMQRVLLDPTARSLVTAPVRATRTRTRAVGLHAHSSPKRGPACTTTRSSLGLGCSRFDRTCVQCARSTRTPTLASSPAARTASAATRATTRPAPPPRPETPLATRVSSRLKRPDASEGVGHWEAKGWEGAVCVTTGVTTGRERLCVPSRCFCQTCFSSIESLVFFGHLLVARRIAWLGCFLAA